MAYIGNNLQVAYPSYLVIDDISSQFNGVLKTFALQTGGSTPVPFPINPQQCLISVNNIIQKPDSTGVTGFKFTGTNIVFATAPTAGWAFFGTILAGADYVNVGANFPSGTAAAPSVTFDESTGTGLFLASSNVLGITTGGVQRLVVNSSGFVGIGTASPSSILDINGDLQQRNGSSVTIGKIENASGWYSLTGDVANVNGAQISHSTAVRVITNGNERLRIDSSGNLLVGGTSNALGSRILSENASGNQIAIRYTGVATYYLNATSGGDLGINKDGAERLRIDSSGRVGIGTTSPAAWSSPYTPVQLGSQGSINFGYGSMSISNNIYRNNVGAAFYINADLASSYEQNAGNHIWFRAASGTAGAGATMLETARIDSSGRLLVGTSSSSDSTTAVFQGRPGNPNGGGKLILQGNYNGSAGSAYGEIDIKSLAGTTARISAEGDANHTTGSAPGRLVFSTTAGGAASPTERMRITNAGYLWINRTTTPSTGNTLLAISGSSTNLCAIFDRTVDDDTIRFTRSETTVGSISVTTTATAYNTSSDYRLKENVVDLDGAIARLNQLPVHRFNFIVDPDHTVDGFIAHEAQAVVPECVTGEKDAVDDDGNPVYQGIDQSKLVPLLTAALQEAIGRIETLESEVAALKAQ